MVYVYILVSKSHKRFYVGISKDPERRINEHNSGKTKTTRFYRPWNLYFIEEYASYQEARKREKYLKSGFGKMWIKNKWLRSSAG